MKLDDDPGVAVVPQEEFGPRFPLVQADAEQIPLDAGCAELVISEYGASVWCDLCRWIPAAGPAVLNMG